MSQILFHRIAQVTLILSIVVVTNNFAHADPITLGTWYEFGFDPSHPTSTVPGCLPADPTGVPCRPPDPGVSSSFLGAPPWTFSSTSPVVLTITDVFLSGDSFQVFDNAILIGSTNVVPMGFSCGVNPNACLANPNFSHGAFLISPGAHSITVNVSPVQVLGEGFFRLDAVPEPSTFLLVALGLVFLIARTVRRSRRFNTAL